MGWGGSMILEMAGEALARNVLRGEGFCAGGLVVAGAGAEEAVSKAERMGS